MPEKKSALEELLFGVIDVPDLVQQLEFAEEDITRATREQASLFLQAARYRIQTLRRKIQKESAYESVCSQVSIKLRQAKRAADDKNKPTESAIKNRINVDPSVVAARREFERTIVYEEFAKLLVEAFRQRRDACRILAEIMGAESNAHARALRSEAEEQNLGTLRRKVAAKYPGQEEED